MIPDGVFPAVTLTGGAGLLAYRQGDPRAPGWVVVYRFVASNPEALTETWRASLPAGSPCFPGLYVLDGLAWLVFHDGSRLWLRNLATGTERSFYGLSNPSAFGDGYFAYTEPVEPYRVYRVNLRTGDVDQPRLGAPTGLSRILDDGTIRTIDEDRFLLPGATVPSFAGPLVVGEGQSGGVMWRVGDRVDALWWPLDSFTPKCAADGDVLAITTAGSNSVRLFCGTLAALIAASAPPAPVPVPIPDPRSPIPVPEPTPMSEPLAASVVAIITRYTARFPVPSGGPNPADDAFENRCRTWVFGLAEQACFETSDPRWGVKNAGGGRPQSKDSLTFNGPALINYDLLSGVGTGSPTLVGHPSGEDITGQTFIPVKPVDHLGGAAPAPTPAPGPTAPPTDSGELAALRADVAALTQTVHDQHATIADLSEQLAAVTTTPTYDQTQDLSHRADAAFQGAQKAKKKTPLDPQAMAHLTWRYLREGYTLEQLVAEAAERGR